MIYRITILIGGRERTSDFPGKKTRARLLPGSCQVSSCSKDQNEIGKKTVFGSELGIFTAEPIKEGTVLFSWEDWVEDAVYGWTILTKDEVDSLVPREKSLYLRYSYDIDFGKVTGTFDHSRAKHISNFMNHSCNPNMIYDEHDNIIARRDIIKREELTIDYGNFIVNFDQDFTCSCKSRKCRHHILQDDWKTLCNDLGLNFPRFMRNELLKVLDGKAATLSHGT